jgi:hypothetical protein
MIKARGGSNSNIVVPEENALLCERQAGRERDKTASSQEMDQLCIPRLLSLDWETIEPLLCGSLESPLDMPVWNSAQGSDVKKTKNGFMVVTKPTKSVFLNICQWCTSIILFLDEFKALLPLFSMLEMESHIPVHKQLNF